MNKVAICVPIYEKARPYFARFSTSLQLAIQGRSVQIVFIDDGVTDSLNSIQSFMGESSFEMISSPQDSTKADVRRVMLDVACELDVDVCVFTDCDDELVPDAIGIHLKALENADFSYSDQILINSDSKLLGTTLFENWSVPHRIESIETLNSGNFVGFSGCALRRSILSASVRTIPSDVQATDWWVFSKLLIEGTLGAQTSEPVVRYRQHANNIFGGARCSSSLADISRKAEIALAHFMNLPKLPEIVRREEAMLALVNTLKFNPGALFRDIDVFCHQHGPWFSDVIKLGLNCPNKGYQS
jgi:glycosyltransferase involved in cell wall biosynthesis